MKYIQYVGPHDAFDASLLLGRDLMFYTAGNTAVPPDMRGNVEQVTNESADELMTYPGHQFAEVEDTEAKELTAKQKVARDNREGLAALQARHNVTGLATVAPVIAALPTPVEVAPAAPRPAAEIKAETKAESAAIKAVADAPKEK